MNQMTDEEVIAHCEELCESGMCYVPAPIYIRLIKLCEYKRQLDRTDDEYEYRMYRMDLMDLCKRAKSKHNKTKQAREILSRLNNVPS